MNLSIGLSECINIYILINNSACVNTGRRFIGIELDEGYFNIAKERIDKAITDKQSKLF